jgi:phospholipid transport system substrate-binding protein
MGKKKTVATLLFVMTFTACLVSGAGVSAQPDPVAVLQGMSDQVIAIVEKDPEILNDKARMREVADEVVVPNVDFVVFSRWVLGKYWRKATPEQRKIFIAEFRELLIDSYLGSITRDDYQNQTIHYKPLRKSHDPKKVTVDAQVEQPNGPLVEVQFRMRLGDSGWMVYDVVVEGVSLVATHRSSFSNIIRNRGIDGLLAMLEEQNLEKKSREGAGSTATKK